MRPKIITNNDIITCAEELIKNEGIKKCSMRRISKELEVAIGTIYNYYKSRDELLLEIFEISWSRTLKSIDQDIDSSKSVIDQVKDVVAIVERDVKNRNGLGKEILIYRINEKGNGDHLGLSDALGAKIFSILNSVIREEERARILSRWIIVIAFDSFKNSEKLSVLEWVLIEQMINCKDTK